MPKVVTVLLLCLVGVFHAVSVVSARDDSTHDDSHTSTSSHLRRRRHQQLTQQHQQQQISQQLSQHLPFNRSSSLSSSSSNKEEKDEVETPPPSSLLCLILKVIKRTPDGPLHHYECDYIDEDRGSIHHGLAMDHETLPLFSTLLEQHTEALHRGEWYLRIYGAKVVETNIEGYGVLKTSLFVPKNAKMMTIPPEEGDLYVDVIQGNTNTGVVGNHTTTTTVSTSRSRRTMSGRQARRIMVLRVSTSDSGPSYNKAQLQQFFFDLSSYSVARQYSLCSSGWLWFRGFQQGISQYSVLDVYVPGSSGSFSQETLWNAALTQVQAQLRVSVITAVTEHVVFVLPSSVPGPTLYGTGTVGSFRTVFNDKYAGIPNTVMHEIGHNLGLNHAGLGGDQYGDETDLMGYGAFQQFGPSKCFNGKHIWDLGWFADRTATLNPFTHSIVTLACFADYSRTQPGQYVVLNVGSFYLVYNLASGVNSGTGDAVNQVTIVQPGPSYTSRVGVISNTSAPFQVPNYGGSSGTLYIKVCKYVPVSTNSKIQVAVLSIGVNNMNC